MAEQAEDAAGCLTSICPGHLVPGAEHHLEGAEGGVGIEVDHLHQQPRDLHVLDLHLDLVFFRKPAKERLLELLKISLCLAWGTVVFGASSPGGKRGNAPLR